MIGVDGKIIKVQGRKIELLKETLALAWSVRESAFKNDPISLVAFNIGLKMIIDGSFNDAVETMQVFHSEEDMTEYLKNRKGGENG